MLLNLSTVARTSWTKIIWSICSIDKKKVMMQSRPTPRSVDTSWTNTRNGWLRWSWIQWRSLGSPYHRWGLKTNWLWLHMPRSKTSWINLDRNGPRELIKIPGISSNFFVFWPHKSKRGHVENLGSMFHAHGGRPWKLKRTHKNSMEGWYWKGYLWLRYK